MKVRLTPLNNRQGHVRPLLQPAHWSNNLILLLALAFFQHLKKRGISEENIDGDITIICINSSSKSKHN